MKRIVLLAGLMSMSGLACNGSDGGGASSPDIYPLAVGNWWHFSAINSQDTSWFVDSILAQEDFGSYQDVFLIQETWDYGSDFEWHAYYADGYLVLILAGATDTMETKMMERYPKVGDSWEVDVTKLVYDFDNDSLDDTMCVIRYANIVSQEDLSTPAGDFQGVFKTLTSTKDSTWYSADSSWHVDSVATNDTYYYWAPGIGMVKYHPYETDTTGYQLDSYYVK